MAKTKSSGVWYEAEVAQGLEALAQAELEQRLGAFMTAVQREQGALRFRYGGDEALLWTLKTVIAVYSIHYFEIARPKALLGHQHFHALLAFIRHHIARSPNEYRTLYLSAAGSDSTVMTRLKQELGEALGLEVGAEGGDLWLRMRRSGTGWEVLIRVTPRPLATRSWRVQNMAGALNASVAHAMLRLLAPRATDRFLNIASGSGTILIESCAYGELGMRVGCELEPTILSYALANATASGDADAIRFVLADARQLPFESASFDILAADLPFGQLTGSHRENRELYPLLLDEAARVARLGARLALITHEIRLMDALLPRQPHWRLDDLLKVTLGGLHPRLYLFTRC